MYATTLGELHNETSREIPCVQVTRMLISVVIVNNYRKGSCSGSAYSLLRMLFPEGQF